MSTYNPFPQYQEQSQVPLPLNTFDYVHYGSQRSKSPSSLINHSGFSPGPLSTPPLSRNTSQPPEQLPECPPDHMAWDDGVNSISNSPTSVRTPDNDMFEFDMLDAPESMRNFYQGQNVAMMTTQVSQQALPAMDMYFTDQAIDEAIHATVASHATLASQPQQYHVPFGMQSQPPQQVAEQQPYDHLYSQNYTRQLYRQDPWTGQGPLRNPNVPQPGMAVFDLASDSMDYTPYVSFDVNNWRNHNTDPDFLVSPNDPEAPTLHNPFSLASQNHAHPYLQPQFPPHNHVPVGLNLTLSSPSPDSQGFVNYNTSSPFFRDNYITETSFSPSSPVASSTDHAALSPYQAPISPQASAPSPGGSEGVFSPYQHSDGGIQVDPYPREQFQLHPPSSPTKVQRAPKMVPEVTFDPSPEPEARRAQSISSRGMGGRSGGRSLGTHLDPKVAKAAHDMRKITACWHCVLQRDKCGPGDICERCTKRSLRPNADCGLGCSRIKLVELTQSFLPTLVTQMHEDSHLTHFVSQYIHQWQNVEITIYLTCGHITMPRIPVKVYEFIPKGEELLVQIQYKTDPNTLERYPVKRRSPALGMVHINHNEEKKYDKYITDIVDNHLDAFGELCWMEDDNDFQQKLFSLMTRVKPKSDDEAKLFREVFRLIVCTFIMSHTLTMAEEHKHRILSKMHSYEPDAYMPNFTSPRMTNRQLKYFFSRLQRSIMSTILNKLQQVYKSSKGCDKWLAAFIVVVGMSMAHEDQQKTIHQVMATKATTERTDMRDAQARAVIACQEVDDRMGFIAHIFRLKYNRKCNPLRDAEHDWEREVGFGDASSVTFVRQVSQLVKDNIGFLQSRQSVSISAANQSKYTSRLVGQFLLSFWLPT